MSLSAVIKKEFLDSIRSNMLVGLTLLFILVIGGFASLEFVPQFPGIGDENPSAIALLHSMRLTMVFFVPLIGLAIGYNSIVGEHESNRLRLMLSLPNTRGEVVFGKFIGRSAVLAVSIISGYAVAGVIALIFYDSFAFGIFGTYTLLTVFYGVVYIAIATGLSAAVKSQWRAVSIAGIIYCLFLLLWDVILTALAVATVGWTFSETGPPIWMQAIFVLNPSTAFAYATREAIPIFDSIVTLPRYIQDWVGFVILIFWIAIPLGLGYLRFNSRDLQ